MVLHQLGISDDLYEKSWKKILIGFFYAPTTRILVVCSTFFKENKTQKQKLLVRVFDSLIGTRSKKSLIPSLVQVPHIFKL